MASFFRQTTELIAYAPLFTETDKTTQAKSDSNPRLINSHKDYFLVGAFSFKEKSPTITVASFFRQTTELIAYAPLFTETDKTTQAKSDSNPRLIYSHKDYFLVGAFSFKEKSPTITVASFFSSDHRAHRVCTTFYRNW